jgi:hypothetical protein
MLNQGRKKSTFLFIPGGPGMTPGCFEKFANQYLNDYKVLGLTFNGNQTLIALGNSFGVSPAKRPYVQQGPYKYLKHPIYIGYFLSELSVILLNFSEYNVIIFLISTALYFYRAILENKFHYN